MAMPRDPYYDRLQHGSYLDRMVSARSVAWFRNVDGSFTVTWIDAGEPRAEVFRTETGAIRFATLLDTTGSLPTEQDVVAAEVAIRELERAAFPETPSERRAREAAERSLAELEQSMEEMEAQEQLESLRPYAQRRGQRVRKHARRAN